MKLIIYSILISTCCKNQEIVFQFDPDTIIAIVAVIVSILALFFSVIGHTQNMKAQRKHNKLSVRPLIIFRSGKNKESKYQMSIKNVGIGPCIIDSFYFEYNGEKYLTLGDILTKDIIKLGNMQLKLLMDATQDVIVTPFNLGVDKEFDIFKTKNVIDVDFEEINKLFKNITLKIHYKDLYNKSYELTELVNIIREK